MGTPTSASGVTLEDLFNQMKIMSNGIAEIKTSQDILVSDNTNIKSTLDSIQCTLPEMKNQLNEHSEQISSFERDRRRRNLVIFGLSEEQGEKRNALEMKICELIEKILGAPFTLQELDFCRRLGKIQNNKVRPVIVGLLAERRKYEIFRNCHKLRGSVISVREDLPEDVRQKRVRLLAEVKRLRADGKQAFVAYDKLVVRDSIETQKPAQKRAHSESPQIPNKKINHLSGLSNSNANPFGFLDNMMIQSTPATSQGLLTGNLAEFPATGTGHGTQVSIDFLATQGDSNQTNT